MTPKRRKWFIRAGIMIVNITAVLVVGVTNANPVVAYLIGGFLYANFMMALSLHRDISLAEHFITQRDAYAVAGDTLADAADRIHWWGDGSIDPEDRLIDATNTWYLVRTSHHDTRDTE